MTSASESVELCIVIVSWNVRALLERCLRSVFDGCRLPNYRVVVVDNASRDGSAEMVRDLFPDVLLMETGANLGFPAAVNQAIRLGLGEYVLLLNPDTLVPAGSLDRLVKAARAQATIGVVGCRIERPDGALDPSCARNFPRLDYALLRASLLARTLPRLFGADLMQAWDHRGTRSVPCTSGACMLLRRRMLDEIGLLDETLPLYFEDVDVCYRAGLANWTVLYLGDVAVTHVYSASRAASPRRVALHVMEDDDAVWLFFRRHRGPRAAAAYTIIALWGAVLRVLLSAPAEASQRLSGWPAGAWRSLLRINVAKVAWALRSGKGSAPWWLVPEGGQ